MAWTRRRESLRLGDYRRVLLAALEVCTHRVALLTITQPGTFDNATAAKRWKRCDRAAKRRLARDGLRVRPLARIAQRQQRGADHLHLVLLLEHELDRRSIVAYVQALRDLGPGHGFGFVDDPFFKRGPKRRDMVFSQAVVAARYLTKYLTEEGGQLQALLDGGGYSWRPLWVTPQLTQASGVNCRRLRRVRHAYFVCRALDQGSSPTLPVWWGDLRERVAVRALLRPRVLAATG